jgi:hypothetical protein
MVIFAGEVGAVVVAEGIETRDELAAVRAAGVSRGQGYGLARPQPLPLAELDYDPVPFVDLVARGTSGVDGTAEDARSLDPVHAAYRMRAVVASMTNGISLLRRSDGRLSTDEFRAICASLARQIEHLGVDLEEVIAFTGQAAPTSVD